MSDSHDALLEEANRCAHRLAGAAAFYRRWQRYATKNALTSGEARQMAAAERSLDAAISAYEEIERRAQKEATG